jgi:sterol desaturase/sphingolipid hydroxylase (fatty acid hydroxylase superfamily)
MHLNPLTGIRLLLPIVLLAIALEIVWILVVQKQSYPWSEFFATVGVYTLHIPAHLLTPLVAGPIALLLYSHRITTIPLNTVWGPTLLFLAVDFAYYWMHRNSHEIRWMWASHIVHHTSEHIHLPSAIRLGATELLSGNWLFYLPLALVGFSPLAVSGMLAVNLFYQLWLHTDLVDRLGPLEWILNTPAHHRVHHGSNLEYLDRNYGGILIIWDRFFGTFIEEKPQTTVKYGAVNHAPSSNPLTITFHEWIAMMNDAVRARSWHGRMRTLFGRPGTAEIDPVSTSEHQFPVRGSVVQQSVRIAR